MPLKTQPKFDDVVFDPPIEADLNGNPGQVSFRTLKELEEWAQNEAQQWSAGFGKLKKVNGPLLKSVQSQQTQGTNSLQQAINQCSQQVTQNNEPEAEPPYQLDFTGNGKLKAGFQHYRQGQAVHAESVDGKWLLEQIDQADGEDTQNHILGLVAAAIRCPIQLDNRLQAQNLRGLISGAVGWELRLIGGTRSKLSSRTKAAEGALEALVGKWETKLHDHEARHHDASQQIAARRQEIDQLHEEQQQRLEKELEETQKRLEGFEKLYRETLRTEAPSLTGRTKRATIDGSTESPVVCSSWGLWESPGLLC